MNKLSISFILLLFCGFLRAQTDTARVNPPTPDSTQNSVQKQPETTTTNTVVPDNTKPNRKRPKGYEDYVKNGKRPSTKPPFTDNVYYGCNLQLGFYGTTFGNALYYDVSPHAGYKFGEFFSLGVQVIYNNTTYTSGTQRVNYNIFGIGGFGRALMFDRFFLQAEYDILSIPARYLGNSIASRQVSDEKLVGLGYKSPLGDKLGYFFVILYDIQPAIYSPYFYNPIVYRAGLSWNF